MNIINRQMSDDYDRYPPRELTPEEQTLHDKSYRKAIMADLRPLLKRKQQKARRDAQKALKDAPK
jgi:hypothetical protein